MAVVVAVVEIVAGLVVADLVVVAVVGLTVVAALLQKL